jgi:hypothetical protein
MIDLGHELHELVTDWIVRRVAWGIFAALRRLARRSAQQSSCIRRGPVMSFAPEVIADHSGKWVGNALRFRTHGEAEAYVLDLSMRWTSVRDTRVVESDDPANYHIVDGRARPIPAEGQPS